MPFTRNEQRPEQATRNDAALEVHSIWKTIQGEGPYAGLPAVFIRLAGCNILCPHCDTDYTSVRRVMEVQDIVAAVRERAGNAHLVVITGGEPFRQNLSRLAESLILYDFLVQVESNGIQAPAVPVSHYIWNSPSFQVVISPKGPIDSVYFSKACAWKYVLSETNVADDGLPVYALGRRVKLDRPPELDILVKKGMIWLQPEDAYDSNTNSKNLQAVLASCLRFGYRVSLQTHKILELP